MKIELEIPDEEFRQYMQKCDQCGESVEAGEWLCPDCRRERMKGEP